MSFNYSYFKTEHLLDTKERQYVRELASTLAATYTEDAEGLKRAQSQAQHVIEGLKEAFPNESEESLCIAARAVAQVIGRIAQIPLAFSGDIVQSMASAYPLAAAALIGVYALPPCEDCVKEGKPSIQRKAENDDKGTGFYL